MTNEEMTRNEKRAATLAEFGRAAAKLFRAQPQLRSAMLGIALIWNDEGDDDIHARLTASPREVPIWPHVCAPLGEGSAQFLSAGDRCRACCDEVEAITNVPGCEAFCCEYDTAEESPGSNFLPYAVARRGIDGVEVEIVGKLRRPWDDMPDMPDDDVGEHGLAWLELPRARALYELVCANPSDDGPRRVLADYLLEHDEVRGEYIALALTADLDAAGVARRDALLATYGRHWLGALDVVIPVSGAHWERGFLARADVYDNERWSDKVTEAAMADVWSTIEDPWATVETIRFVGEYDLIEYAMIALRDVGPVRHGLITLAKAPKPWAIERLHAVLSDPAYVDALWSATTLPRLTHLVLEGRHLAAALARPRPAWWQQLERLTLWSPAERPTAFAAWRAECAGMAPWVAVSQLSWMTAAPGWEVATGPSGQIEISLAGWHEFATSRALVEIVEALPRDADVALARSPYWTPLVEDAERISAEARCPVRAKS